MYLLNIEPWVDQRTQGDPGVELEMAKLNIHTPSWCGGRRYLAWRG